MKVVLTSYLAVATVTALLGIGCTAYADLSTLGPKWDHRDVRDHDLGSWKETIRGCVDVVVTTYPAKTRQARQD